MSNAKAAAVSLGIPLYKYLNPETNHHILPVPMLNIINGGKHADNSTDIQEFMIVPTKFSSFQEAMRGASEVYHTLRRHLARNGHYTTIGDEGGFAPRLNSNHEALADQVREFSPTVISCNSYPPMFQKSLPSTTTLCSMNDMAVANLSLIHI